MAQTMIDFSTQQSALPQSQHAHTARSVPADAPGAATIACIHTSNRLNSMADILFTALTIAE